MTKITKDELIKENEYIKKQLSDFEIREGIIFRIKEENFNVLLKEKETQINFLKQVISQLISKPYKETRTEKNISKESFRSEELANNSFDFIQERRF